MIKVIQKNKLKKGTWVTQGTHNASSGKFPCKGGSGRRGIIKAGNIWDITEPGELGGVEVNRGCYIRALVSRPGQEPSNWRIHF